MSKSVHTEAECEQMLKALVKRRINADVIYRPADSLKDCDIELVGEVWKNDGRWTWWFDPQYFAVKACAA